MTISETLNLSLIWEQVTWQNTGVAMSELAALYLLSCAIHTQSYLPIVVIYSFNSQILGVVMYALDFSYFGMDNLLAFVAFIIALMVTLYEISFVRAVNKELALLRAKDDEVEGAEAIDSPSAGGGLRRSEYEEDEKADEWRATQPYHFFVLEGDDSFYLKRRKCVSDHYRDSSIEKYMLRFYGIDSEHARRFTSDGEEKDYVKMRLFEHM